MMLNILYEDNHIIVVVKPSGILSQEDITKDPDMVTLLKKYIKDKYNKPGDVYLGLVQRLDRMTSGVMVFARTSKAASRLSEQIRNHSIIKKYYAVVEGKTKDEDKLENYLIKDEDLVKSFVTTNLVDAVAEKYGAEVKSLLTGFKYIGEFVTMLEAKGESDRFIVGMEESYGYLSGIHARDKDAVVACALICEMAAYYKSKGKSLYEVMEDIYAEHGMYLNALDNYAFKGSSGMVKMGEIMDNLRNCPPQTIAGM
jgi:hypothetical protein